VVGGAGPAELYDPRSETWAPTGALSTQRSFHRAILIDPPLCRDGAPEWCGKVLVAGGGADYDNYVNVTSTSELYEPTTGKWTATGNLIGARGDQAFALLLDGRVLAAGGRVALDGPGGLAHTDETQGLATAEVYDPRAGTWTAVADMSTAGATSAVTLAGPACAVPTPASYCGRVLVGGGDHGGTEVFDPATGTWTATSGTSAPPRQTLTALRDGRVLAVGGGTTTAALYDPATSTWSSTGTLGVARSHQSSTLIDGAACQSPAPPSVCGKVLVLSGADAAPAELYDPASGSWTQVAGPGTTRYSDTATLLLDGTVLVAGGSGVDDPNLGSYVTSVEVFEPPWTEGPGPVPGWVGLVGPTRLSTDGGTTLVILGQGFEGAKAVQIGGVKATSFHVDSPTRITAVAPPHPPGSAAVAVAFGAAPSAMTDGTQLQYAAAAAELPAPQISSIDPRAGFKGGGTSVTIFGSGFYFSAGDTDVRFGDERAARVTVVSETRIIAVTPPTQAVGPVTVTVRTPASPEPAPTAAAKYSYGPGLWSAIAPLGACPTSTDGVDQPGCGRRSHATATVLDGTPCRSDDAPGWCGSVLVAGGARDLACRLTFARAERYDPSSGRWHSAGTLATPRFSHTATLLPDGQVLVVGGKLGGDGPDCDSGLASAERYDPASNSWSPAGELDQARFDHTATLLDGPPCRAIPRPPWCGKVLVAGGAAIENFHPPVHSAQLYDPATNAWEPTGSLAEPRSGHTATALPDGRVLVTGGFSGDTFIESSEIYDPASGEWSPAAPLAVARGYHTATLLEGGSCGANCGRVLVAGGTVDVSRGRPFRFSSAAELYDPGSNQWLPTGLLDVARGGHTASLLPDGKVLVVGGGPPFPAGAEGVHRVEATAELYDAATGRWSMTSSLGSARGNQASAMLGGPRCRATSGTPAWCGAVLVAGGSVSGDGHVPGATDSVELYSSAALSSSGSGGGGPPWAWLILLAAAVGGGAGLVVYRRRAVGRAGAG
jgi:N-acetylneuraminic acid mutarotase